MIDVVAMCLFGGIAVAGALLVGYWLGKNRGAKGWRMALKATEELAASGFRALRAAHEVHVGLLEAALARARGDAQALRERFHEQLDETAVPSERGN